MFAHSSIKVGTPHRGRGSRSGRHTPFALDSVLRPVAASATRRSGTTPADKGGVSQLLLGLTTAALTATTLLVPDVAHAIGTQKIAEWAASGLIFKDTVEVTAIDDPEVDGLTIYISDFKRSIVDKLAKDFFTEPSQASLSCGISGPVAFRKGSPDDLGGIEGKEVFSEQKGLNLFKNKTLRVRRVYDPKRNSVVYVAYSTRLNSASDEGSVSSGRYRTSVCVVKLPDSVLPAPQLLTSET
ncbi:CreA protein-domain-containing protein [Haematococcus lacustris]